MRTCTKCGAEYPADLEHFPPHKQCTGGIAATCRPCWRDYQRAYKIANREKLTGRRRTLYAERHSVTERAKHRQRLADRPLHMRASILRQGMIDRSKKRGIPFDSATFTIKYLMDWIERTPTCPCCGVEIDYGYKVRGPNNFSPSIDRFEAGRGYVPGNVALICWRCNNLKRDATADELEAIARWMRAHTASPH